ncbi:uncharacterized protein LOC143031285 isoform X3 [Oratosquilla oratoria]|uniref:uncharacterized protein LOC143031285 isoform X3 n=1 Tax=Oratosquilla oratoria TaxID=337810 RepID=UPI003F768886
MGSREIGPGGYSAMSESTRKEVFMSGSDEIKTEQKLNNLERRLVKEKSPDNAYSSDASNLEYIEKDSNSLIKHIQIHKGEKTHKCTHCDASFSWPAGLKRHILVHTLEKPHKCTICDASFSQSSSLKGHMRIHTGEKPFNCSLCEATFSKSCNLKSHIWTHIKEKPLKCSLCGASFSRARSLDIHIRKHTGEKPYKCTQCKASFSGSSNLQRHLRIHANEKLRKCTCESSVTECDKDEVHDQTCKSEKPDECPEGSLTQSDNRKEQEEEKPYKCNMCSLSFSKLRNLDRHVRNHTSEKTHKCSLCVASFTRPGDLKRHIRTHTGEKPYNCTLCDASFSQSGNLKKHIKTHKKSRKRPKNRHHCHHHGVNQKSNTEINFVDCGPDTKPGSARYVTPCIELSPQINVKEEALEDLVSTKGGSLELGSSQVKEVMEVKVEGESLDQMSV